MRSIQDMTSHEVCACARFELPELAKVAEKPRRLLTPFWVSGDLMGLGVLLSKRVIYLVYWFAIKLKRGDLLHFYIPSLLVRE